MAKLEIRANEKKSQIHKEIYGHFSEHLGRCIYGGVFVGENSPIPNVNGMRTDVVEALKKLQLPVLRWPGGCFADEYHWMDGIGPKETRKKMINTHWGGVTEDNSFGTHEFMELCRQVGCQPYVNGNVGSGTVREMSEWVEYMTFGGLSPMAQLREQNGHKEPWNLQYFAVGNENWGCGGNMRPEYYADEYRRYQTYCRNYDGNKLYKIACGPSDGDYRWTEVLMERAGKYMDGLSLHFYTVASGDWRQKGSATDFDTALWYKGLKRALYMEELVTRHGEIMDKYDPEKRVGLIVDEWGMWHDVEPGTNPGFLYQQNTMRDALVAGCTLNIFNHHSDRVRMANIAQLINVLQSVILTEGDKMLLTPTYHVFDLYRCHMDATLLSSTVETKEIGTAEDKVPNLSQSASMDKDGNIAVTVCNLSESDAQDVEISCKDFIVASACAKVLTGAMTAHNTFEQPETVAIQDAPAQLADGVVKVTLPACSVMQVLLKK